MKKFVLLAGALCCAAALIVGCGKPAADTEPIGAVLSLTGSQAFYGTEARDGALLAIDQINAAGGLLGKKLALIIEDDGGNPDKSVNAFTKLTKKDKVSFIIGSSSSGTTLAMSSLAQGMKVVLISPSATELDLTAAGDYIFRACFIDPFQGIVGADFARNKLGVKKAAVLYDEGADYSAGLAGAFKNEFKKLGGEIVADESYMTGEVDFSAQINRIRKAAPDLVYLPNYYNDVALQAKELRAQGVKVPLLGGDAWDGLVNNAGDEVLNCYWSSGFAADEPYPKSRAFVKAYEEKFNKPATQLAALGYDSVMLLADGIKAAGSFDSTAVKDAMAKLNGSYVTGNIRFDSNRNPIKSAAILKIEKNADGKLVNVYDTTVNP